MCPKVASFVVLMLHFFQQTDCWKPISSSAAYSLQQTFPDFSKESVSRSAHTIIHHSNDASGSVLNSFKNNEHAGDVSAVFSGVFVYSKKKMLKVVELEFSSEKDYLSGKNTDLLLHFFSRRARVLLKNSHLITKPRSRTIQIWQN